MYVCMYVCMFVWSRAVFSVFFIKILPLLVTGEVRVSTVLIIIFIHMQGYGIKKNSLESPLD
jgi:hypothetical protein